MKIIADQNIPLAEGFFADLGELIRLPGRSITAEDCQDADILLVRSITQVNARLLENSRVQFVGSCTIGTDHLDTTYLDAQGICWANAPGCNANAVVQYVLSAMAWAADDWQQKTVGIVGCGNIGSRLYRRLQRLGVDCCVYDPLLAPEIEVNRVDFDSLLQSDIITCHTPLTRTVAYPTYHLFDQHNLRQVKPGALLINSGRGAVIDNQALLDELNRRGHQNAFRVVLDVWENEPELNLTLLQKVNLATPHIAGYSLEGRERGTFMVYQALMAYLQQLPDNNYEAADKTALLTRDQTVMTFEPSANMSVAEQFNQLLLACYSIDADSQRLKAFLAEPDTESITTYFDDLRKHYPFRREYPYFVLPEALRGSDLAASFAAINSDSATG